MFLRFYLDAGFHQWGVGWGIQIRLTRLGWKSSYHLLPLFPEEVACWRGFFSLKAFANRKAGALSYNRRRNCRNFSKDLFGKENQKSLAFCKPRTVFDKCYLLLNFHSVLLSLIITNIELKYPIATLKAKNVPIVFSQNYIVIITDFYYTHYNLYSCRSQPTPN